MSTFLGAGDWDGDGHRDVVLFEHSLFDTSSGNVRESVIGNVVTYWGNASGALSNDDTTRLSCGVEWWIEPQWIDGRLGQDADGDDIDDLAIISPNDGFADGSRRPIPRLHVFTGGRTRWRGKPGANRASTVIWNLPDIGLDRWIAGQWIDHDRDGALDLALRYDVYASPASVAVVYGRRGGELDSTAMESLTLSGDSIGYSPRFIDVTGDRVPELVMATGELSTIRIYLGLRGQRLKKQFGSGLEPPNPGAAEYWGRPWAQIMLPRALSPDWPFGGYGPIFDLGNLGRDDVDDIASFARPYITVYNGGNRLDSLVDGLVDVPETDMLPGFFRNVVCRLGDIDGSGVETIAVGFGGAKYEGSYRHGAVLFFKPSWCVPREGRYRELPPGTDRPALVDEKALAAAAGDELEFSISPVPSDGPITARWAPRAGAAVITVSDALGRVVYRSASSLMLASTSVDLAGLRPGTYLVTLTTGQLRSSRPLVVR
ncbi:MAG TPA: T9SS type A sorting domain-containing protein [Candidatus Kapabacteria bacterium]|nr:T9SS type A sorting domain-containing protein [Candidatus Kapabacteria bacterium]